MSIVRRAVASLERRGADPRLPWGDSSIPPPSQITPDAPIGEQGALAIAAVYGSVRVISDAVATLPLEQYTDGDPATRLRMPSSMLLAQPYSEISLVDWLVQYTISMALRGEFFGRVISRQNGFATQIKPIHPDQAQVRRLADGSIEYRYGGEVVPDRDVFHVKYLSVPGALRGLNPIQYLRTTFGLARNAEAYANAFLQNSAMPGGVIQVPGDLDEDETRKMAQSWKASHGGIGNAGLPAVLTDDAKFNPITITPEDSQFLETQQYSEAKISGLIFGVPPHMIGIVDRSTSWGTGIAQQEMGFVNNTLSGYQVRLENALTAQLPDTQRAVFNIAKRVRGDKNQRYEAYALGMNSGFICADDARLEEGMAPAPDGLGKVFMVPINSMPVEQAIAPADPVAEKQPV